MEVDMQEVNGEEMDTRSPDMDDLPSLETLPTEIILHILQYLEVRYICDVLSRVSSYFRDIARDQATWKVRLAKRWPGQYPAVASCQSINWALACTRREEETWFWSRNETSSSTLTCSNAHYSCVDAVKVLDNVVVSGSRDRGINLWGIDTLGKPDIKPVKYPDSHKGWVWSFSAAGGDKFVSGSWDNTLKFWQVTPTSLIETRKGVNLKVAVLATDVHENRVVAGTYDKKVVMLDKREDMKKMTFFKSHSMPVLDVKLTERWILSLSEDKFLAIYDRIAGKRLKKVEIPGQSFPMCFSLHSNSLYVGDKGGGLHLIDCGEERFDVVEQYKTGHSGKITSVSHGWGSLHTASSDGDIKVFHPNRNLEIITTIKNPHCGEVAQIDYSVKNKVLAAAFSNNTVKIWSPPTATV